MNIAETTAPKSDQQNFDDYLAGPRTVTITEVKAGSDEQPVEVHLKEYPGRPFKPSKSMRRVLVAAWGGETEVYTGRRMTLVGDPSVKFGGNVVGGVRIAALSDIAKTLTLSLTTTRGKRAPYIVQPLTDPPRPAQPASTPMPDHTATLIAAMGAAGLTEKATALAFLSQSVGRDVKASRELTADEVAMVLDELQNAPGGES